ncbi:hypothetical protein [Paenibacillus sp. RC343]|nr:hypothetical protein [Paenibacillus sp. RC343]
MNVSVHQLRYFEEKGILYPSYTEKKSISNVRAS